MKTIHKLATLGEISQRAAGTIIETARTAVDSRGIFTIALSGGSTPIPLYELLGKSETADSLPWEKISVFWSDERLVPPDHPQSNYRSAQEAFLRHRSIPPDQIHRMKGELPPDQAAQEYELLLQKQFQQDPPRLDIILLGLGSDGHTASLFPGTEVVNQVPNTNAAANYVPKLESWRLTFTPRLINHARKILFLVSGSQKAPVVKEILENKVDPEKYPAALIEPIQGTVEWFLDRDAAELLT